MWKTCPNRAQNPCIDLFLRTHTQRTGLTKCKFKKYRLPSQPKATGILIFACGVSTFEDGIIRANRSAASAADAGIRINVIDFTF